MARVGLSFGRVISCVLSAFCFHAASDAFSQNLVSRPVGFLRITVPSNTQVLASQPFTALDETGGSPILKWDSASGYTSSAAVAQPGEGFWLVNKQPTNQVVFLAGEVALASSNTALLCPGLNLVGYPYSAPLPLNKTALGALTNRVEILGSDAAIPPKDGNVMGMGYWVKSLSDECIVWTELRPYENAFPNDGLPDITAIATKNGSSVVLTIECNGDESFEIFYQDISQTNQFSAEQNWQLAETGIKARGQSQIEWVDSGSKNRSAADGVVGRYYLVGRADIDLDGDGVPDARERFAEGAGSRTADVAPHFFVTQTSAGEDLSGRSQTNSKVNVLQSESTSNKQPKAIGLGRIIYVDRSRGNDLFNGRAPLVIGGDGPKRTIRSGLGTAEEGDTIVIREGKYPEDLDVAGRELSIRIEGNVDISGGAREVPKIPAKTYPMLNVHTNGTSRN